MIIKCLAALLVGPEDHISVIFKVIIYFLLLVYLITRCFISNQKIDFNGNKSQNNKIFVINYYKNNKYL